VTKTSYKIGFPAPAGAAPTRIVNVSELQNLTPRLGVQLGLPVNPKEVATLDRAHDDMAFRKVEIVSIGKGVMSQSRFKNTAWQVRFESVATPADLPGGRTGGSVSDRWQNPLTGYTSSADPLSCNVNNLTFNTPTEAMEFCMKRGWMYEFPHYPSEVCEDNGDIVNDLHPEFIEGKPNPEYQLWAKDDKGAVALDSAGSPVKRKTYTTWKVPPFFDGASDDLTRPEGYGPTTVNQDAMLADPDIMMYDENFLTRIAKNDLKKGMDSDFWARAASFKSHYYRPLKFHGDGEVRQHGNNQLQEKDPEVEGHQVVR